MLKQRPAVHTIDDMRKRAREDAAALIGDFDGHLNRAADSIGMSRGRLSFINRGVWTQVAVNQIDLVMLETGRVIIEKDLDLTQKARELLSKLQDNLADLHATHAELMRVMRKL